MPREPESFEGAVAQSIQDWLHKYIPAVAESLGPLPDTVEPTRREKASRWSLRSDKVPPGVEDQLADEALKMILEEHQQGGTPVPDPDTLTKLTAAKVNAVLYPYRHEVYGRGLPRPAERVREAERYAKLAGQQQPIIETVEPTPAPAPPAAPEPPAMLDALAPPVPAAPDDPLKGGPI